jgi:prepilin-type N-terminal cleavage/methylation domain-containing protein
MIPRENMKMDRRFMIRRARRSAYSLIEVMIGVAILALGLLPVFSVITGGEKSSSETVHQAVAANLAMELMNELKTWPLGLLTTCPLEDEDLLRMNVFNGQAVPALTTPQCLPGFKRFISIQECNDVRCKRIKVAVVPAEDAVNVANSRSTVFLEALVSE